MTAVITVNENEYGVACVFNTSFNMSAFTTLSILFIKPDGTTLLKTSTSNNVTCPNVNISTALGTFLANQYAQYYFIANDLNQTGVWQARVIYDNTGASPSQHLISNLSSFTVNP